MQTAASISWLLAGQVDLAILPDPSDLDELHIDRLASENLGLVAAPNSGLACGTRSLRLHDLDRLPLILPGKRHWTRRLLARAAFQRGLRCEPAFEIDSLAVTKDMVRRGVGYAVLPVTAVRDEAARGALVFCPVEKPPLMAGYAIARASAAPAVLRDAGRTIRGAIQSLIASSGWPGVRPWGPAMEPAVPALASEVAAEDWRRERRTAARKSIEFAGGD